MSLAQWYIVLFLEPRELAPMHSVWECSGNFLMLQALDMAIHVDRTLEWVFEIALDCRGSSLSEIQTAGNDGILNDLMGLAGELQHCARTTGKQTRR